MDDVLELEADEVEQQDELETPTEGEPAPEGQEGEQPAAEPVTSLFDADGKKFNPVVRGQLDKIKTENPDAAKLITRAMFQSRDLLREFPGGVTEAKELRDKVDELGGFEGISEKIEDLEFLNNFDQAFTNADPSFVDKLIEAKPESFDALAPVVFDRYAKSNPEGFAAYLGRVMYSDLQRCEIPLLMARFQDVIADNPKAMAIYAEINSYLGGFKTLAEKPATKIEPKSDASAPRPVSAPPKSQEWITEANGATTELAKTEYSRIVGARKPDAEDRAQIETLYLAKKDMLAEKYFPGWKKTAQEYLTAGNKPAFQRYMASIDKRVVSEAVNYAVSRTLQTPGSPVSRGTAQTPKKAPVNGAPTDATFKPVSKEPDTWEIDYNRTSVSMLNENKAILKGGSKVAWRG